jgi:protoporphyrinogen oxidase
VWRGRAPSGHALFRCIYGGGRDPAAFDLTDRELIATAHQDLAVALGVTSPSVYQSVVRWETGIPHLAVGHRNRVDRASAVARKHRLVLAGADYRGVAVNDICADSFWVRREIESW